MSALRRVGGTGRRRFLQGIAALLASPAALSAGGAVAQEVAGRSALTGAGSTFAYPIVSKWSAGYRKWVAGGGDFPRGNSGLDDPPTAPALDYEPVGSLAGIMRVRSRAVDFAATEMPLTSEELRALGLVQFPILIGGVVAVANIEGVATGQLQLTPETLADIFLGKIRRWSDPAIKESNPGLALPDAEIAVIRRSDGSGTTFNFTDYLSKVSPEWREKVGRDLLVPWPVGTGAKGNDGVSLAVRQVRNSIGYVEYGHARQSRLRYALIRNRAGRYVTPNALAFQEAAAHADWAKSGDFHLMLTDPPGEAAYPIVATVFIMMPKTLPSRRARAALDFFGWSLDQGAQDATALGYVPLPPALVSRVKEYWASNVRPRR